MLKFTIFALCCVAAWAASMERQASSDVVPIVAQDSDLDPEGNYHFSFEGGDGTKVQQVSEMKSDGKVSFPAIAGFYEYKGADGVLYHVDYTADENGFHAEGEHIPKIPDAIVKALKYIEEHPAKEEISGKL